MIVTLRHLTRTALVLHGGGGPATVAPIVAHLGTSMRVIAPTHPGWDGTARTDDIASIADLAKVYLARLRADDERDVVVVGSSIGGWIALEMAVQAAGDPQDGGTVGAIISIDGTGLVIEGEPGADFFALDARGLAEAAWHDPERGYRNPATMSEAERAVQQSNRQAMAALTGPTMSDATLLERVGAIEVPTLLLYGASDRIVTPAYGRAAAAAIGDASFAEIPAAGHLPHLEEPAATWAIIDAFLAAPGSLP